ncbi:MAG TPA: hypothetical protein VF352_02575 [Anaerolineales bacterium]
MILLILVPLWMSLACVTLTSVTPAGTQGQQHPASVEVNIDFGPGTYNFQDTKAGLSDLTSYKATLIMSFDGTQAGKTEQWSKTYVMLTTKEPAATQLTIEKTGSLANLDAVFMAEAAGAAYERRGTNTCNATVIDPGNSLRDRLEPAGFLNFVIGAEEAGVETVNNVAANHYTFDERAFGQLGLAKSTGELWVASEGGYIVKYVLTTKGDANYFGTGIEGSLTLDYELTDVNQPVTFALPADCPAGMVNAPQLPDAANVQNMPGLLTYDTASSLADVAAFYQAQIPNLGWMLLGAPTMADTTALMEFTQGDQTMTVIITAGDGGTTVQIVLGSSQVPVPAATP